MGIKSLPTGQPRNPGIEAARGRTATAAALAVRADAWTLVARCCSGTPAALILLGLWLLATAGWRPLLLPDEGRYAGVALGMLQQHDLLPRLDGLPFFHKPPLFYWIGAAAMQLIGIGPFAARAGSIVGAWIMGATLYVALHRWHGAGVARIALGVLATSPFFFVGAQYANHDMLVAGLICAAIWALARAVERSPAVDRRWLAGAALACALATLTKGLIGVVLPALVIGPWLLLQGRWRQCLGLLHPVAWIVYLGVAAPWFVAMQLRFPGFFDYFFMEQHVRRFMQTSFNNVQPGWFFLAVLPLSMLPWALYLPRVLRAAWSAPDARVGLYLWWTVAIVGFFSWPSSKLVGYVMPALPPLAALIAIALQQASRRHLQWILPVAAFACVTIVGAIAWRAPGSNLALARALSERVAPEDKVAMVDEYLYDVPFYAGLRQPVVFASDWRDPRLAHQDNWRKELADAARFAPALGEQLLLPIDRLDRLACGSQTLWIAGSAAREARVAGLTGAERVFSDGRSALWRVAARDCA